MAQASSSVAHLAGIDGPLLELVSDYWTLSAAIEEMVERPGGGGKAVEHAFELRNRTVSRIAGTLAHTPAGLHAKAAVCLEFEADCVLGKSLCRDVMNSGLYAPVRAVS